MTTKKEAALNTSSYIGEIVGYVPITVWCEFEGCSRGAIDMRINKGIWQRGVHIVKPTGGKMMVNLKAAKKWLEENLRNSRVA